MGWQQRTALLLDDDQLQKLQNAHVLIIGLGGVGGYAVEQVARAGVGKITLVDGDVVEQSNRNRQLAALVSTDNQPKAQVLGNRVKDINPDVDLTIKEIFLDESNIDTLLDESTYDFVIECIDTLTPKVFVIKGCVDRKLKFVSAMGAGGRLDPSQAQMADISETYNCFFSRKVRKRLRQEFKINKGVRVVFSPEDIDKSKVHDTSKDAGGKFKRSVIGTISFMPAVFGLYCGAEAVRGIIGLKK
ncbi:tRNA threonylcarbamoyladenosine dehydratase [Sediminitomix flava]|uniref:tRNA A37 threonylcarbamoyladenosine dehydratase n=1 Tax=Sediminitomix flava TaxID=379075 RepID=A0A315ZFL0_SEDFL|nr:tRNA threonylcarbamoyladenosine dehydratase [Sediminitomix flava]PWJ43930.1 tRNA A37 threonylcarbamoyladenosine dehydratase [Sediminitomix flava]